MERLHRDRLRLLVLRHVELPAARALKALGLTPNAVTVLGLLVSVVAAGLAAAGWLLAAGLVFLAGGVLDLMDGALARYAGQSSKFGAFLDSVMDRLGEAALFLGLAIYAVREVDSQARLMLFIVSLVLALVFSQTVSYARARGEGLGIQTRSGLMTRPERVVLLSICLAIGFPEAALIAIAAVSLITTCQRVWHIRKGLDSG